ncbi:MAG TPA: hypothetical protein VKN14_03870 [Flavobacteriaceae bacterium]|nr:hypothetical protein [Flavobacteriaceae bacterium]
MIRKEIFKGIFFGILANSIGLILATLIFAEKNDILSTLKIAQAEGFLGKLISLGAILNLIVFFYFIRKKQDYRARGVLLFTIFVAIFTFILM